MCLRSLVDVYGEEVVLRGRYTVCGFGWSLDCSRYPGEIVLGGRVWIFECFVHLLIHQVAFHGLAKVARARVLSQFLHRGRFVLTTNPSSPPSGSDLFVDIVVRYINLHKLCWEQQLTVLGERVVCSWC